MTDPGDTQSWIDLARALGEKQFLRQHRNQYFLLATTDGTELPTVFHTAVIEPTARTTGVMRRQIELRSIKKAVGNPYPDRVSVGRTKNCDIVFRHPTVSKLHAHFSIGAHLVVIDAGSVNGTRLCGELIPANRGYVVHSEDRIQFGSVQTMVLDAEALYETLMRLS